VDNREKTLDEFFRKNDTTKSRKYSKEVKKSQPDKIGEYFDAVTAKKASKKRTFTDKLIDFFRLSAFKSKFDEKKVGANQESNALESKNRFTVFWFHVGQFLINRFSFEAGVDILDDTSVLYRKNLVIKNILAVTNLVFLIFVMIGSEGVSLRINLILSFVLFLIMFFTNLSIKKIIHEEPKTLQKQQMAEYISAVYILMMAVVVFIKLRMTIGNNTTNTAFFSITQAGYALIYFSLVVLALYQDSKLLKMIFKVAIILMTIVHVTILYPVYLYAYDFTELFNYLKGPIITDIILRTLVLAVFMIALYSTARITEDMNNKRKEELIKRRAMEKDFKTVVSDVFDVISVYKRPGSADLDIAYDLAAKRVADLSSRLGNYLGFSPKLCKEIYDFSTIHIDKKSLLTIEDYDDKEVLDEVDFKKIREKTIIGSIIIKRLQLDQKAEEIVRAHFEKTANSDFIKDMNGIHNNRESQVILLAQMYEILRQDRNYKRGLKHSRAIDLLQLEFYPYFDSQILDRFIKYGEDFEALYYKITKE